MIDLSPATASIVKAFDDRYELLGGFDNNWQELCIAAALRAAADQVVPDLPRPTEEGTRQFDSDIDYWEDCQQHRANLLAIAAELEAQ